MGLGVGRTISQHRLLPVVVAAAGVLAAGVGIARGAVGDVAHRDCFSGWTGLAACTPTAGATADGLNSGFNNPRLAVVSPNGRSLYVVSRGDVAISHFRRADAGVLAYAGCITADSDSGASCAQIPGASPTANDTGMRFPEDIAISPDGRSLYVAAGTEDALTLFNRDLQTGDLTHAGCVTSESGLTPCTKVPGSTASGSDSPLESLDAVKVSPDGGAVYAGSSGIAGVAHLARSESGALEYRGCLGADTNAPCERIPGHVPGGSDTGFASQRHLAVSPDGRSLYTADDSDEAVGIFSLAENGTPVFEGCLTGATMITNCTPIPGATANGDHTGLRSLVHVSVSPDGRSVYTASDSDTAVAHFQRAAGGALTFAGCFSGETEATGCTLIPSASAGGLNSGLDFTVWVEPSPDGHSVYALGASDDAIASFGRDPATGALSYGGCISAETGSAGACSQIPGASVMGAGTGFDQPRGLAISPEGRSVYVTAADDDAVTRLDREADTTAPSTQITAGPADGALLNVDQASFEFSSADGDLAAFGCETGSAGVAAFEGCSSPFTMNGLADGEHSFAVRGTDIQGNEGAAESRSFTVDTTAPALRIRGKKVPLDRKRRAKVRLRCPAGEISGPCRGTVKLKTRKKVKLVRKASTAAKNKRKKVVLAKNRYRVAAGKTKKVKLRLSKRKAKTVRKRRKARKIRVIAKARDEAGNKRKAAKKAKLKPKKKKR